MAPKLMIQGLMVYPQVAIVDLDDESIEPFHVDQFLVKKSEIDDFADEIWPEKVEQIKAKFAEQVQKKIDEEHNKIIEAQRIARKAERKASKGRVTDPKETMKPGEVLKPRFGKNAEVPMGAAPHLAELEDDEPEIDDAAE